LSSETVQEIAEDVMQISAEVRLWWRDGKCEGVEDWFEQLTELPAGGTSRFNGTRCSASRRDDYVIDLGQAELGIKVRGSGTASARTEIKALIVDRGEAGPFGR
jgi:hypothetical protein